MGGAEWEVVGAAIAAAILHDPAKRKHLGERVMEVIRDIAGDESAERYRKSLVQNATMLAALIYQRKTAKKKRGRRR